jgi:uncharacterized protein YecE (DUF72 family)
MRTSGCARCDGKLVTRPVVVVRFCLGVPDVIRAAGAGEYLHLRLVDLLVVECRTPAHRFALLRFDVALVAVVILLVRIGFAVAHFSECRPVSVAGQPPLAAAEFAPVRPTAELALSVATARVGISGWRYPPWRGVWYPRGLPQRRELEFSAGRLNSIELNGSFYSLQRPTSYQSWYAETPPDFVFAVKGGRFITHLKRLRNVDVALANFFASGVLALQDKLGPILWQLPERHAFDRVQLEEFFALLPRTTTEALALARKHELPEGRAWLVEQPDRPLRHALEARHPGFIGETVAQVLRANDVSFVVADAAGVWPSNRDITSDFVYVRLHGAEELYASGYSDEALNRWASDVQSWLDSGRDVYVYFDNDTKVRAPFDAVSLARILESRIRPSS